MRSIEELEKLTDAELMEISAEERAMLFGDEPPAPTDTPIDTPPAPTEPPSEPIAEPPVDTPAPTEPPSEPAKTPKLTEMPVEEVARIAWERANEANKYKQKAEAAEKRLAEAKAKLEQADVWDSEFQKQKLAEVEELKLRLERMEQEQEQREAQEQAKRIIETVESNLERLAGKTSKPLAEIDRIGIETGRSLGRVATTSDLVERGIDRADAERYVAAVNAQQFATQRGISFKSAWIELGFDERFERPSVTPTAPSAPQVDPRLVQHNERSAKATPTLPGNYGSSSSEEITPEFAMDWLAKNSNRQHEWGDADRATFAKIQKLYND